MRDSDKSNVSRMSSLSCRRRRRGLSTWSTPNSGIDSVDRSDPWAPKAKLVITSTGLAATLAIQLAHVAGGSAPLSWAPDLHRHKESSTSYGIPHKIAIISKYQAESRGRQTLPFFHISFKAEPLYIVYTNTTNRKFDGARGVNNCSLKVVTMC